MGEGGWERGTVPNASLLPPEWFLYRMPRIVSTDKMLRFINTLSIIIVMMGRDEGRFDVSFNMEGQKSQDSVHRPQFLKGEPKQGSQTVIIHLIPA